MGPGRTYQATSFLLPNRNRNLTPLLLYFLVYRSSYIACAAHPRTNSPAPPPSSPPPRHVALSQLKLSLGKLKIDYPMSAVPSSSSAGSRTFYPLLSASAPSYVCVNCLAPAETLFHRVRTSNVSSIVLSRCSICSWTVDRHVEHDLLVVSLNVILHRRDAFVHLLYNRFPSFFLWRSGSVNVRAIAKSLLSIGVLDSYLSFYARPPSSNSDSGFRLLLRSASLCALSHLICVALCTLSSFVLVSFLLWSDGRPKPQADRLTSDLALALTAPNAAKFVSVLLLIWSDPSSEPSSLSADSASFMYVTDSHFSSPSLLIHSTTFLFLSCVFDRHLRSPMSSSSYRSSVFFPLLAFLLFAVSRAQLDRLLDVDIRACSRCMVLKQSFCL